jgi:uncharacterized protein (DUF2249 family)
MKKILLDAREMEHPEPLQVSLSHLRTMENNEYLYMINLRKPIPLIEIVKEKELSYITHQDNQEIWHILISKNKNHNLTELLDV